MSRLGNDCTTGKQPRPEEPAEIGRSSQGPKPELPEGKQELASLGLSPSYPPPEVEQGDFRGSKPAYELYLQYKLHEKLLDFAEKLVTQGTTLFKYAIIVVTLVATASHYGLDATEPIAKLLELVQ